MEINNWVFKILLTIAALSGLAVLIGMILTSSLESIFFPKPKISKLGDVLPMLAIVQNKIILSKNGACSQIIRINGVDSGAKTTSEMAALVNTKQRWLDKLAEQGAQFKIITLRREYCQNTESGNAPVLLKRIHARWMGNFEKTYANTHYIVLTVYPKGQGLLGFLKKDMPEANTGLLKELVSLTLNGLNEFNPEIVESNENSPSEIMSLLHELTTTKREAVQHKSLNIADYLSNRVTFVRDQAVIQYDDKLLGKIISLNQWGDVANTEMLKEIQTLPGKMIVLQLFKGYGKITAAMKLKYQRSQKQLVFKNVHIEDEYSTAIEEVEAGKTSFYDYQLSILVISEDLKQLEKLESQVYKILMSYSMMPIVEKKAKEFIWRSQFPGTDRMIRSTNPLSCNLSYLIHFESEPQGLQSCDWGQGPIRSFKTASSSSYAFQFHVSEDKEAVGHSLVVAPTRGGKTTLFQHLIGGALRHENLRAFIFDRLNGTRIFTEAVEGNYVDFSEGSVPLNPFVCEDTHSNRDFLNFFLLMLAKCQDDQSIKEASLAVEQIFRVPVEERILSHCFQHIARKDSLFAKGLRKWALDDSLSGWFNGTTLDHHGKIMAFDSLDLSANRLTAFEMTKVQLNPQTAAAVTTYIMHRIRSIGREAFPHLIFIDETAPMLEDQTFLKSVEVLLREHAKLKGVVCVCFQDTKPINSVILNQCKTWFLFPNPAANAEDYKMFDLTQFEWDYIKGFHRISKDLKRSVLLKKPGESVILNVDLSPLGNLLQIYRSGSEPLKIVRELQQKWGINQWVERYLSLS